MWSRGAGARTLSWVRTASLLRQHWHSRVRKSLILIRLLRGAQAARWGRVVTVVNGSEVRIGKLLAGGHEDQSVRGLARFQKVSAELPTRASRSLTPTMHHWQAADSEPAAAGITQVHFAPGAVPVQRRCAGPRYGPASSSGSAQARARPELRVRA